MNPQHKIAPTVRAATVEDIPFLARMDVEASLPPFGTSFWDELLECTGTETLSFLEAMLREGASNWGDVSDFIILERDGEPMATCAVFKPETQPANEGPLNLDKLDQIAQLLSWSDDTRTAFRSAYEKVWSDNTDFLKPQADLIIETVAVVQDRRGEGLGTALIEAAFARGRDLGANSIGIMVIHGNDGARSLYEKHFEPFATFHGAYFDHEFPGLTKYRASLTSEKE